MRKRGQALFRILVMLGIATIAGGFVCDNMNTMNEVLATEGTTLQDANPGDGVEYNSDAGTIVLNGNSVIIQNSATEDYYNIIIDENQNGVVDGDETKATVKNNPYTPDLTEVPNSIPISVVYKSNLAQPATVYLDADSNYFWGINQGGSTAKLFVYIRGGEHIPIYGSYQSTAVKAPVYVEMSGGTAPWLYGLYETTSTSSVEVKVSGGTITGLTQAVNTSEINTTESPAVALTVSSGSSVMTVATVTSKVVTTGDVAVKYALTGGTVGGSTSSGPQALMASWSSIVKAGDNTKTALDVDVTGSPVLQSAFYAAWGNHSENTTDTSRDMVGNVDVDVHFDSLPESSNVSSIYGIVNGCKVDGSLTMNLNHVYTNTIYATSGSSMDDSTLVMITGNSVINCTSSTVSGPVYNVCGALIGKDAKIIGDNQTKWSNLYCVENDACVEGNVVVDGYGDMSTTGFGSLSTWEIVSGKSQDKGYSVGGNVAINVKGGELGTLYCINYGGAVVKGDVECNITDARVANLQGVSNGNTVLKNLNYTFINAGFRDVYFVQNSTIAGDVKVTSNEDCYWLGSMYGVNSATVGGNCTMTLYNDNADKSSSGYYHYFVYGTKVEKDVTLTVNGGIYNSDLIGIYNTSGQTIGGAIDIDIKNCKGTGAIYGVYGTNASGQFSGTVNVDILNCDKTRGNCYGIYYINTTQPVAVNIQKVTTTASTIYGIYNGTIDADNITVTVNNNTASTMYGFSNCNRIKDGSLTMSNNTISGTLYGAHYVSSVQEAFTINSSNNAFLNAYMMVSGAYLSDVFITSTGDKTADNATDSSTVYFVNNWPSIHGKLDIEISGSTLASFEGANGYIGDSAAMEIVNSNIGGGKVRFFEVTDMQNDKSLIDIDVVNSKFTTDNVTIDNSFPTQHLELDIADDCVMPNNYTIVPNACNPNSVSPDASAIARCKERIYLSGTNNITTEMLNGYTDVYFVNAIEEMPTSLTLNNLYLNGSEIGIGEDITLEANKLSLEGGVVALDGTLKGTLVQAVEDITTKFFMNGGQTEGFTVTDSIYYPITSDYDSKLANVVPSGINSTRLRMGSAFALSGGTVSYKVTPNTGYDVVSGTVTMESDTAPRDMSMTDSTTYKTYSFTMEDEGAAVEIVIAGKPIKIGKTVADPIAKVNVATTKAEPLYDLSTLVIANDTTEGDLAYAVDSSSALPVGLVLEDGKIYGTPTVVNEAGNKTDIIVTGRNGSTAKVTLNIVVTAGEGSQSSQDGRIMVDAENSVIYLFGNSVVIEEDGDNTAIYLDDNRDGVRDNDIALVSADLSAYTIYGFADTESDKTIKITMTGGNVNYIYGAYNSVLNYTGSKYDAVKLDLLGGTVAYGYVLYNSQVSGTIAYNQSSGVGTGALVSGTESTYTGSLYVKSGAATVGNSYTLHESLSVKTLTMNQSTSLTIPSGVSLKTTSTVSMYKYAKIYCSGQMDFGGYSLTNAYNSSGSLITSKIYIAKDATFVQASKGWGGIYYEITSSNNIKNISTNLGTGVSSVLFNEENRTFAEGGTNIWLSNGSIQGYEMYYSMNGADYVLNDTISSSIKLTMPTKSTHVDVTYVAKQIELEEQFAAPVGVKGTTYTVDNPLYDYNKITINNDTTATYGGEVKYTIKSGTLPSGLYLEDGKVIGTAKVANGDGVDVTVMVTGRNGSTADTTMKYQITDVQSGETGINNLIDFDGTTLDLKGNSVVIFEGSTTGTSNVYLDANHDGRADSTDAFLYNGTKDIDLSAATICGYSDTTKAYEGDVSIYLRGGTVGSLYGAKGTSNTVQAVVNGSVSVYVKAGTVNNMTTAGYYASADTMQLIATGGVMNTRVCGAYYPKSLNGMTFTLSDMAKYNNTINTNDPSMNCSVVYGGIVTGDVNVNLGVNSGSYGFYDVYSKFYGLSATTVTGDVNYKLSGVVRPKYNGYFVYNSKVTGDLNVASSSTWLQTYNGTGYMVYDSTVRDINFNMVEDVKFVSSSEWYVMGYRSTARNVVVNAPSYTGYTFTLGAMNSSDTTTNTIQGYGYVNKKNIIDVYGEYTMPENADLGKLTIHKGAKFTIPEGNILNTSTYVLIDGELVNNGTWNSTGDYVYVGSDENGAVLTNNGIWYQGNSVCVGNEDTTYNASLVNNGTWEAKAKIFVEDECSITNNNVWTSYRAMNTAADSTIENAGTWVSNYYRYNNTNYPIEIYGVVNNTGTWENNNYLYFYELGKLVNEGSFVQCPLNNSTTITSEGLVLANNSVIMNEPDGTFELGCRMTNNGTIYNYGTFEQTYSNSYFSRLGTIYCAKDINVSGDMASYTSYYNTFYFPIEVEYPTYMISSVSDSGVENEYVTADTNHYVAAGTAFTVTMDGFVGAYTIDNVDTVTYGRDETVANASGDTSFTGTMPYEATTVTVNMKALDENAQITLTPADTTIDSLTVGKSEASVFNMANVAISGDTVNGEEVTDGYVIYSVNKDAPLPDGLTLQNGIISGTPTTASTEPIVSKIIVTGKNQTRETFTITFSKIEKGIPKLYVPSFSAKTGDTLANVTLPKTSLGTYAWPDTAVEVTDKALAGATFTLNFTPSDTANYDWSKLDSTVGTWNEEKGVVELQVKISLNKIAPTYTTPTGLTAQYGQTLADVALPSDENGTFTWYHATTTSVGAVGTKKFYVTYTPKDTDRYTTVNYIPVTLTVEKADREAPTIDEPLRAYEGDTIASVILPDVDGGIYKWVTTSDTIVEAGKQYKVLFKPDDTTNYNWSSSKEGAYYSSTYGGIIFEVTINTSLRPTNVYDVPVELTGTYGKALSTITLPSVVNGKWYLGKTAIVNPSFDATDLPNGKFVWTKPATVINQLNSFTAELRYVPDSSNYGVSEVITVEIKVEHKCTMTWQKDANKHWQTCSCGKTTTKTAHTFDAGVVTKEATETATGVKTYTCTACKYTKTEMIPMIESKIPAEGTELKDKTGNFTVADEDNIDYEDDEEVVDDGMPVVVYTGPANKSAKTVVIPDTITVDGVTYKVTAIADGAFKKNTKLTSVTIGNNIKMIGNSAFESCTKLKKVTFKKTSKVVTIGKKVFYKCSALTTISIPESVKNINDSAFDGCKKLKTVSVAKKSKLQKIGNKAFNNCVALKKFTIPDETTKIGSKAFYNCKKLTSLTIKSQKLTAKSVGKQALTKAGSSNYKKLVVKVPKKKLKAYKSLLVKKGLSKKAKIKK